MDVAQCLRTGGTTPLAVGDGPLDVLLPGTAAAGGPDAVGTAGGGALVGCAGGTCAGGGVGCAAAPAGAGHKVLGTGLLSAPHASGYTHPLTIVTICPLSCVLNQPSATLPVALAKAGGGSVIGLRDAV